VYGYVRRRVVGSGTGTNWWRRRCHPGRYHRLPTTRIATAPQLL